MMKWSYRFKFIIRSNAMNVKLNQSLELDMSVLNAKTIVFAQNARRKQSTVINFSKLGLKIRLFDLRFKNRSTTHFLML